MGKEYTLTENKIKDYNLKFISMNIQKKDIDIPNEITIGMQREYKKGNSNKEKYYSVIINLVIVGSNDRAKEVDNIEDIEDDLLYFKSNIMYCIEIDLNKNESEFTDLDKVAWILAKPTYMECVNYIGNKVGLPQLRIPSELDE